MEFGKVILGLIFVLGSALVYGSYIDYHKDKQCNMSSFYYQKSPKNEAKVLKSVINKDIKNKISSHQSFDPDYNNSDNEIEKENTRVIKSSHIVPDHYCNVLWNNTQGEENNAQGKTVECGKYYVVVERNC